MNLGEIIMIGGVLRSFKLLCAAVVLCLALTANRPAAAQASPSDWAGFVFGLQFGYALGHADWSAGGDDANPSMNGVLGGLSLGYRWALAQNYFLGAMLMAGLADSDGDETCSGAQFRCRSIITAYAVLAAQAGMSFERFLIYGSLGMVLARAHHRNLSLADSFNNESTHRNWRTGLAMGLAMEYLIATNLSVGLQYWYWHFGRSHERFSQDTDPGNSQQIDIRMAQHLLLLSLVYRFRTEAR